ncbi:hypothetical protein KIH86_11250 [Paenibacillus sp. HN-1]|uniref:hypothetical protein n=1 Tax=Paenibacillus TaxID=44249 RepID=UPI001CA87DE5|nr:MULTISPECIES: hypothetical protein [Paenibacillus]MBY9082438.1 hypothetical protein [Paenibacillus sp. CGMCC 1.18879]MBY9084797.1 hypothetical protein [Paenibacillus sinensis]
MNKDQRSAVSQKRRPVTENNKAKFKNSAALRTASLLLIIGLLTAASFPLVPHSMQVSADSRPGKAAPASQNSSLIAAGNAQNAGAAGSEQSPLPKRGEEDTNDMTASVLAFARQAADKLAESEPFKAWKNAKQEIESLGPGTHGWLVHLKDGDKEIGYMIITSSGGGGYVLSEYGTAEDGIPYSLTELRQFLAQKGIISLSGLSGASFNAVAFYLPLLPYWKVTIDGSTLYVNALHPEILPWNKVQAQEAANAAAGKGSFGLQDRNLRKDNYAPSPAVIVNNEDNPYANLGWLTSPRAAVPEARDFPALLQSGRGLVYRQSGGANELSGGPLLITGYQQWSPPDSGSAGSLYAAAGGSRFLPLDALRSGGTVQLYNSRPD